MTVGWLAKVHDSSELSKCECGGVVLFIAHCVSDPSSEYGPTYRSELTNVPAIRYYLSTCYMALPSTRDTRVNVIESRDLVAVVTSDEDVCCSGPSLGM